MGRTWLFCLVGVTSQEHLFGEVVHIRDMRISSSSGWPLDAFVVCHFKRCSIVRFECMRGFGF